MKLNKFLAQTLSKLINHIMNTFSKILNQTIKHNISFLIKSIISFCLVLILFLSLTLYTNNFFTLVTAPKANHNECSLVENNPLIIYPENNTSVYYNNLIKRQESYPQTAAWLYLPGTDINDPVMQAKDNDFFLRRDDKSNYSYHGCYFADFRTKLSLNEELSKNIVVYGHNIFDDGKTFAQLLKYKDWEHMVQNPYVYLATENGIKTYRIYSAFYTFIDFYYINPNPDEEEFNYCLDESRKRSLYNIDIPVSFNDNILTLSTCCYKYKTNWGSSRSDQRFVVQAVELNSQNNQNYIIPSLNPSPKEPYDKD